MTIARAQFEETDELNAELLVRFVHFKNPQAKKRIYAEDFIRFGNLHFVNWLGLFAVAYLITEGDPFWVGVKSKGWFAEGGTMSRYNALAKELKQKLTYGEHFAGKDIRVGKAYIDGDEVESLIQEVLDFSEAPDDVRKKFPPKKVVKPDLPDRPAPVIPLPVVDDKPVKKPFWWKLARKPVIAALSAVVGIFVGNIPIVGQYVSQIVELLVSLIERLIF